MIDRMSFAAYVSRCIGRMAPRTDERGGRGAEHAVVAVLLARHGPFAEVGGEAAQVGDVRRILEIPFLSAATGLERQTKQELVVALTDVVALILIAIERGRGQVDAARVLPPVSRAAREQHERSQ